MNSCERKTERELQRNLKGGNNNGKSETGGNFTAKAFSW